MEIIESKIVDMLTADSVSILTRKYVELDGVKTQVGDNHRCSYVNSKTGRALLEANEPENVVSAVLAIWGSEPTIIEEIPEVEETETPEEETPAEETEETEEETPAEETETETETETEVVEQNEPV